GDGLSGPRDPLGRGVLVNYLDKIAKEQKYRDITNGLVRLNDPKALGFIDYTNPPFFHFLERKGRNSENNSIIGSNIHVFKIESVKFMHLLNFKSFFTLFSVGKGELKLLDRFKVQKRIAEGKLWGILNL